MASLPENGCVCSTDTRFRITAMENKDVVKVAFVLPIHALELHLMGAFNWQELRLFYRYTL